MTDETFELSLPSAASTDHANGGPDAKDALFLTVRAGASVTCQQLDDALGQQMTADPRDLLLCAYWLASETTATRAVWWNDSVSAAPLLALALVTERYSAGWGGNSEYPMTTWVHDQLQRRYGAIYIAALDELVIPRLNGGPLPATQLVTAAHNEARLRACALLAADVPGERHDHGRPPPLAVLLGDLYEQARPRRRRERLLSATDFYAAVRTWSHFQETENASAQVHCIAAARLRGDDPYRALCASIKAGQRAVSVAEAGAHRFVVEVREQGVSPAVSSQTFDTSQESFAHAVSSIDELRESCAAHNAQLTDSRHSELLGALSVFEMSLTARESASSLAARKAAAQGPALDAASAVRMLRARV